ncbi:MAG TPA: hypothetical protein VG650_03260 [Mycobacteriales bacterium]|nr:hypothetical protein [Mycobacteriales bacterium]
MTTQSCDEVDAPVEASDAGSSSVPGREFGMAKLAAAVLGRPRLDVLLYGAGHGLDHLDIAQLPRVRRVAVGDAVRLRDEPDVVDTSRPSKETFDIVVAGGAIEQFRAPRKDFAQLFGFVHRAGIVVCSTDIYDGGDLGQRSDIFRGAFSYYTPEALRRIAKANRMHVDFRLPAASKGVARPRARYVIFSHSQDVMESVCDFFGRTAYAPSEKPIRRSRAAGAAPRAAVPADTRPSALG